MDLAAMQAEVVTNTVEKGWYETDRSWGDEIALLHSEVSEALEAFRDWGLKDMTGKQEPLDHTNPKPEGVGSELADVLIRLLDTCHRYHLVIEDKPAMAAAEFETFGDAVRHLHSIIAAFGNSHRAADREDWAQRVFWNLSFVAGYYQFDLEEEYTRKHAYNKTRPHRHGGRAL